VQVLMLVATSVATDTRVLREATSLALAGHSVHIIGKQVPPNFLPPPRVTVSSVSGGSALKPERVGSLPRHQPSPPARFGRWLLLPEHRNQVFRRWAHGVLDDAATRKFDVVHAHDFTALAVGHRLARSRGVPLVYDSHEMWSGRPRVGRPTPVQTARERRVEAALGGQADAVLTVGEGVADALRDLYGWRHVTVVRNTFPLPSETGNRKVVPPCGAVYAGRLAPYRELEAIATASRLVDLRITLMGPADETWLARYDAGAALLEPALAVEEVDLRLAQAGLALVTHSDRWQNHRLALPNKLFHAVRAGVPVVATDVGELAAVVRRHGLGVLYRPGDGADLARALREAVARYGSLVSAVRRARPALSWDVDAAALLAVYSRLSIERSASIILTGPEGGRPNDQL
jgi:glycogen(starch) synthase